MDFSTAVRTCFRKYVDFEARARRSEYWYFALLSSVVLVVVTFIGQYPGLSVLRYLVVLGFLLPSLAVGARRLHDTGRSGWFLLLGLIPLVGAIILIVWFAGDSEPGTNQHGPNPKGQGDPFGQPGFPGQPGHPGQAPYGG